MQKRRLLLSLAFAGLIGLSVAASSRFGLATIFESFSSAISMNMFDCAGGASESFANIPTASSSSYSTRNWTGDNGLTWSATDARTDQTLAGKAIALRTGTLKNTVPVSGGVGTLSFNYKRVFTGNSTLKVYVNGVQVGTDITVSSETPATFSQAVNVSGNATVEIKNSGNRTVVDDVAWTCYTAPVAGPELQLADATGANKECGNFEVDFGTHPVNVYTDAVINVKNTGTSNLVVSNLTLNDTTNFQIVSPAVPFTVTPSSSAIVLVRFESATSGEFSSTLSIASNDLNEGKCAVTLTGTAVAPCAAPDASTTTVAVDSIAATSASVTVAGITADGYIAVLTQGESLTAVPSDATAYAVNDTLGGGTVVYNGTSAAFELNGLSELTNYSVFVFPYNTTACAGGPVYATTPSVTAAFSTPVAPCIGGSETFANIVGTSSAYSTRTWTGDNGVAWTATDARTDQTLNGKAIGLRTGAVSNTTPVTGGMGTLSFSYKRIFTNNSTLRVFVNGTQYGGDITVDSDTVSVFTQAIDVAGPVTVELRNSGNRIAIDDIAWNCYQTPERPEIQLIDVSLTNKACGNFAIDLGNVAVNTNGEASFSIKNQGSVALEISSLAVNDTVNYTVVSPVAPFTVDALGIADVTVRFNTSTAGVKAAVLTITSNDADESECTVALTANAQNTCVAPVAEGRIAFSNISDTTTTVEVTDTPADGYIAIIMPDSGSGITAPVNGTTYTVGTTMGDGVVAYVGSDPVFDLAGLTSETSYIVSVFAYNTADCFGGPAYAAAYENLLETIATPCTGGSETFSNIPAAASAYATRTWTGDNGLTWSATDSRTDQVLNGKAITVRTGTVKNTTAVGGGIGTLTFNYARIFTGNSTMKVFVNGTQLGADITVSADSITQFTYDVNVTGDVTVEIRNSGNRIIVDDIAWTCYAGSAAKKVAQSAAHQSNDVVVYPNPTKGEFRLGSLVSGKADVTVFNMQGKTVLSQVVEEGEAVALNGAERGIYLVSIKQGETMTTKKLVVE